LHTCVSEARIVHNAWREHVRIAECETFRVAKLITRGWTSGKIVSVRRRAEREEVVARPRCAGLTVATEERVLVGDVMIDANVVAVDDRVFFAISLEVATRAGTIRKWKRIHVSESKRGESTTTRTVPQIVSRNGRAVRSEDSSYGGSNRAASCNRESLRSSRFQQLTEITDTHT